MPFLHKKTADAMGGTSQYLQRSSENKSYNEQAGIYKSERQIAQGITPERLGNTGGDISTESVTKTERMNQTSSPTERGAVQGDIGTAQYKTDKKDT